MKPVKQTRLYSEEGPPGNCYAACVASLLECPIDDVPQPTGNDDESWIHYWPRIAKFLHGLGFQLIHLPSGGGHWLTSSQLEGELVDLYIANGPGARGVEHSVVMRGLELAHDPHPSGDGLLDIRSIEYLVPLDPAVRRKSA